MTPNSVLRTRVLVEARESAVRASYLRNLAEAGYAVATCAGPDAYRGGMCPLAAGKQCALAEGADVIYSGLDWRRRASRDVIRALRRRLQEKPVVVEANLRDSYLVERMTHGCTVVTPPGSPDELAASIERALVAKTENAAIAQPG